jgi:hypothetical protein
MVTINNNAREEEAREEEEPTSDSWSDEGARRFNEALDEGNAYVQAGGHLPNDLEMQFEEEEREYRDPELCDLDEETLPPGEMELIFENSYIM